MYYSDQSVSDNVAISEQPDSPVPKTPSWGPDDSEEEFVDNDNPPVALRHLFLFTTLIQQVLA